MPKYMGSKVEMLMWEMSQIEREDLSTVVTDPAIPWECLSGKTILISGATRSEEHTSELQSRI